MNDFFVDIHTHSIPTNDNIIAVYNTSLEEFPQILKHHNNLFFSLGVHPWELSESPIDWELLEKYASYPTVKMIGECGMDKNIDFPLDKQIEIFKKHITISEKLKKPIIIHCVRCFNELFELRKKEKPTQRWVIHGFRGKPQLAIMALQLGFDLSYGIYHNPFSVKATPSEHLFIESDEKQVNVEELYQTIATLKNVAPTQLNAGKNLLT